jgi:hypothetical protein
MVPSRGRGRSRRFEEVEEIDEDDYEVDEELVHARRKRNQIIIVTLLVVIALLIVSFYFLVISPPGVLDIYPGDPYENSAENGIVIPADVAMKGTGQAEGEGDLKIKHLGTGETTYSTKVSVKSGKISQDVKYTEFVTQNGEYDISISFEGITRSFDNTFRVDWVVEFVNVTLDPMKFSESQQLSSTDDPYFTLKAQMRNKDEKTAVYKTNKIDVEIELFHEDQSSSFKKDTFQIDDYKVTTIDETYDYTTSGVITAKVKVTNEFVKSDSSYKTVEGENLRFINTHPRALAELDDNDGIITLAAIGDNGVANFDASDSFDLDGSIVKYQWVFGDESDDNVITTTEPEVSHTYTETGTFTVTLTVTDNEPDKFQGFGIVEIEVTVRNF